MKLFKQARKYGAKIGGAAAGLVALPSFAAVPAEATTAITTAGTDMLTAVGAVIVAMVAVWGLRKLGQKMGWM